MFTVIPFSMLAQAPVVLPVALQGVPTTYLTYGVMALVTAMVPMLVAVIKVWFPKLEKSYSHVFPVVAMLLGMVLVWVNNQVTAWHITGVWGIFLGAAGVGLREVYDQTKTLWPSTPVVQTQVWTSNGGPITGSSSGGATVFAPQTPPASPSPSDVLMAAQTQVFTEQANLLKAQTQATVTNTLGPAAAAVATQK